MSLWTDNVIVMTKHGCHMTKADKKFSALRAGYTPKPHGDKGSRRAVRAAHAAHTEEVVPALGHTPVPGSGPQEPRVVVPRGAPAQRAVGTLQWTNRINDCSGLIGRIPIPAPFPDIPNHVIKPPGIGDFLTHRMYCHPRVLIKPGVLPQGCRIVTEKPR